MSIHIYVLPLSAYYSGDFQTISEKLSEIADKPGFLITPEGYKEPEFGLPELDTRHARESVKTWVSELKEYLRSHHGVEQDWDESGGLRYSTNTSWIDYASVYEYAQHVRSSSGEALQELMTANALLPITLRAVVEFRHPFGEDSLKIGSSSSLLSTLRWLQDILADDSRSRELRALPPNSIVTGALAEFSSTGDVLKRMIHVSSVSNNERIPIILE